MTYPMPARAGLRGEPSRVRPAIDWRGGVRGLGLAMSIAAGCLACLMPLYLGFVDTFESLAAWLGPAHWSERPPAIEWATVLVDALHGSVARHHAGTVGSAFGAVLVSLFLAVTADYAFGRSTSHNRWDVVAVLGISLLPQVLLLSGAFELARRMQLYNHWWGLSLPYLIFTLPVVVWAALVLSRPQRGADAPTRARASVWQAFPPLAASAFITTAGVAFIAAWNEFMYALTFVLDKTQNSRPVCAEFVDDRARVLGAVTLVALALGSLGVGRWRKRFSAAPTPARPA